MGDADCRLLERGAEALLALAEHRLPRRGTFDDDAVELFKRGEVKGLGRAVGLRHLMAVTSQQRCNEVAVVVRYVEHSRFLRIRHWGCTVGFLAEKAEFLAEQSAAK